MRLVLALACVALLAGCVGDASPHVVISKATQDNNGVVTVSFTLKDARGIDDWDELEVVGCQAPASGPLETPHKFQSCGGRLVITHESAGVLYDSSATPAYS